MIAVNSIVEFKEPTQDEYGLVMKVLEVNGDRLLVEYLVNLSMNPTGIVSIQDVKEYIR